MRAVPFFLLAGGKCLNSIDGVVISAERPDRNVAWPGWFRDFHLQRVARLEVGVKTPVPRHGKKVAEPLALSEPSETGEIEIGQAVDFGLRRVSGIANARSKAIFAAARSAL